LICSPDYVVPCQDTPLIDRVEVLYDELQIPPQQLEDVHQFNAVALKIWMLLGSPQREGVGLLQSHPDTCWNGRNDLLIIYEGTCLFMLIRLVHRAEC